MIALYLFLSFVDFLLSNDETATLAFEAFNSNLLDPRRNLWWRDTDKPQKLGAIWTQAHYLDIVLNAYQRTGNKEYLQLITKIYQGALAEYDKFNWSNSVVWFIWDDMMWWVITLARAYEVTGEQEYLDHSVAGFNYIYAGSYDPVKGGMEWNFDKNDHGKMACINYPTIIAALTLHKITGDESYRAKAEDLYAWSRVNLFNPNTGMVADSMHEDGIDWHAHTYNQATQIGSAVMLHVLTGRADSQYLQDALKGADYVRNNMSGRDGIINYDGDFNIDNEQGVYVAIFAQYIARLIADCGRDEYVAWLQTNIQAAWNIRDHTRNITWKDYRNATPTNKPVTVYDASGVVALMQLIPF